jgi:hypothetical protein
LTDSPTSPTPLSAVKSTLKARREEIAAELFKDLPVPGWDNPRITVRYRPLEHPFIARKRKSVEKAKGDKGEAEMNANLDLLIEGCVEISADNGEGPWDGFDPNLAEALGVESVSARQTCKALFFKDGDVVSHTDALIKFSGYVDAETEGQFAGE